MALTISGVLLRSFAELGREKPVSSRVGRRVAVALAREEARLAMLDDPRFRSAYRRRMVLSEQDMVYHLVTRVNGSQALLDDAAKERLRWDLERVARYCGVGVLNYAIFDDHFHLLVEVPRLAGRLDLGRGELVRRIGVLYGEELAEKFAAALEFGVGVGVTAVEHFGAAWVRRGVDLDAEAGVGELARDWALRELERHREQMQEVSLFMRLLKLRFSLWFNGRAERYGTLWTDAYRSLVVEPTAESVQAVSGYIDMNAVRRGLVENPESYAFCGVGEAFLRPGMARQGLARVLAFGGDVAENVEPGRVGDTVEGSGSWAALAQGYRELLWGTQRVDASGNSTAGTPSRVGELPPTGQRSLCLADFFRWRQRVFRWGVAMGTRAFVEAVFYGNKGQFGPRKPGSLELAFVSRGPILGGWDFPGMAVLRSPGPER
jgi:putative transposase